MAIEFNCPHCEHQYKLKDELAGRTATCRNPACRQKLIIPQPTITDDTPLPSPPPAEVEAAALAALSEEPKVEEKPAEKLIPVECNFCGHKWTEPFSRAGKNTLCPNPECKQRIKIPEPKEDVPHDWRQQKSGLPSLAKKNFEKPTDVQDAGDTKMVSGQALKEGGVFEDEIEPRPLKQKIGFVLAGIALLAGMTFGIRSCYLAQVDKNEHRLMEEAQKEFADSADSLSKDEQRLFSAVLHIAAGEYAVRHNDSQKLKEGLEQFAKARDALRSVPPGPARNAVSGELALAVLSLGGTEEQVKEQHRIRWVPEMNLKLKPNERVFTVHEELRQALGLVKDAEFDFRNHLARRLARALTKLGQAAFAEQIPIFLFPSEQDEAKAIVALEIYRTDPSSPVPRKLADELKSRGAELTKAPSAQTLFLALSVEKPPQVVSAPPPGNNPVSDNSRFAYCGAKLMEKQPEEALTLAKRGGAGDTVSQLRALVLCADWSADRGPALDSALALITINSKKKDAPQLSPYSVLRLSQIAAKAGKPDQAKQFADFLADEGLRVWAKGDAVRCRVAATPKERAEETWIEVPDDSRKQRAGHAWGRLWVARQNASVSGDRAAEVKAISSWPSGTILPFGKAGIALGLQDQEK
ncbi:MAG: hypothetical protein L0241_16805 [Planctomycetia bacterium]|nr:hypothetical protein [Planctomycetia bacterium]